MNGDGHLVKKGGKQPPNPPPAPPPRSSPPLSKRAAALVRADSVHIPLRDDSVDLIVTSPPYFALRSYTDDGEHYDGQIGSEPTPQAFVDALWAVTRECVRVLKPTGSLWVNLGDKYGGAQGQTHGNSQSYVIPKSRYGNVPAKSLMGLPWRYAIGCIDDLGLILRAEVIWNKPNGLPESVTDRVRRSHEQWFHFTKEPRYFAAVDEVREPHAPAGLARRAYGFKVNDAQRASANPVINGEGDRPANPLGKLPGSVWTIPSEPLKVPDHVGVDHFAAFPQEWPRRIILGWSPSGICTACGEGRRPVVNVRRTSNDALRPEYGAGNHGKGGTLGPRNVEANITGYACACPDTSAPTRPAVVLDPFCGTGTTVMVARALGRYGVGLDLSNDYLRLARWRIWQSGHAAKTRQRTHAERQGTLL